MREHLSQIHSVVTDIIEQIKEVNMKIAIWYDKNKPAIDLVYATTHKTDVELEKVVLSHPWIQKIDHEVDIKKMFSMLLRKHPSAMVYLWYHPHFGLWLGASPESLLNIESSRFSTMSLAGTIKSKDGLAPKWSKKEIGEQDIVTEYIKNQLAPLTSLIKVHPTKNVKAGQLWHLQTKIIN